MSKVHFSLPLDVEQISNKKEIQLLYAPAPAPAQTYIKEASAYASSYLWSAYDSYILFESISCIRTALLAGRCHPPGSYLWSLYLSDCTVGVFDVRRYCGCSLSCASLPSDYLAESTRAYCPNYRKFSSYSSTSDYKHTYIHTYTPLAIKNKKRRKM